MSFRAVSTTSSTDDWKWIMEQVAPRNTWVQLQPIHIDWSDEVAHCDRLISDALRNISARMSEVHQAESIHITTLDGLI